MGSAGNTIVMWSWSCVWWLCGSPRLFSLTMDRSSAGKVRPSDGMKKSRLPRAEEKCMASTGTMEPEVCKGRRRPVREANGVRASCFILAT